MKFLFSELCDKEVINCSSGTSIGFVIDITISCDDGKVISLLVCQDTGFSFRKSSPICIPWEKVDRIGKDFIIVNGSFGHLEEIEQHEKLGFKTFFSKGAQ